MIPDIFDYLDYRQYVVDVYHWLSVNKKVPSARAFARMVDSTSPNFLQRIRDRKVCIAPSEATMLCRALHLPKRKRLYLEALVSFDQASTHEEKEWYFLQVLHAREYKTVKKLDTAKYRLFSEWYVPVVRELVTHADFTGDPSWIAKRMVPAVSAAKVAKALKLLLALNLIRRDNNTGKYVQTHRAVRTPSEVVSVAVGRYHRDAIAMGRQALDRFGAKQRDIRSATLGVPAEAYEHIKQRMESFWRELLAYGAHQDSTEEVYQINMQLFPMSRTKGKRK